MLLVNATRTILPERREDFLSEVKKRFCKVYRGQHIFLNEGLTQPPTELTEPRKKETHIL